MIWICLFSENYYIHSKHGQCLEMIFKNRHISLAKAVSSQNVSNDFFPKQGEVIIYIYYIIYINIYIRIII